jgi:hypothetical protein
MRAAILLLAVTLALPRAPGAGQANEILVTFSGLLKYVTSKQIVIEPEPDNEMTFVRTKRTRFLLKGHETDGARIPKGSVVSIDATQKLNGDLEAVTVTVTDAAPKER